MNTDSRAIAVPNSFVNMIPTVSEAILKFLFLNCFMHILKDGSGQGQGVQNMVC